MKIAVVGTGIAGNVAAYMLNKEHEVTVFEANDYVGGHTHTHDISVGDESHAIDTGFIVFNYRTYPEFTALLAELNVDVQPSNMSFSVKHEDNGLEYNGNNLNSLFAQRRNLFRPSFIRMIREILRFNREAIDSVSSGHAELPLGLYLEKHGYSREFIEHYIIPMGAAIWSTDPKQMQQFPANFFIRFFHNHGLLSVNDRPQWYVIKGGSRQYVRPLIESFRNNIRLSSPVQSIVRHAAGVVIKVHGQPAEHFDAVFIAAHSDQALAMLDKPSVEERQVLGAIAYQPNEAVLHTDTGMLPKSRRAWAAWNYHILKQDQNKVALTYNMNILQGIDSRHTYCVTLNNTESIDPAKIIKRVQYAHPCFTPISVTAQQKHNELNGHQRTWYCGAWWGNGFHEDGVVSAIRAVEHFKEAMYEKLHLRRAG